jgi:hypothetical protein
MTVITETIDTIAGVDSSTTFAFSAPNVRDSSGDNALITTTSVSVKPVDGVLTTPDLDPGTAVVQVGLQSFTITIPDSATPIRLWPLIEAALPVPPAQQATAVINGGGAARIQVMTADDYAALVSTTTPDPGSVFLVY